MNERRFCDLTPKEQAEVESHNAVFEAAADGTLSFDSMDILIAEESLWAIYNPKAAHEAYLDEQAVERDRKMFLYGPTEEDLLDHMLRSISINDMYPMD